MNRLNKLDGGSMDINSDNVRKLKELFPDVVVEGKVDIDKLLNLLGSDINDDFERYEFKWKGKTESLQLAGKRSGGSLRPCLDDSKNWDITENLYIEGDNLEVLKLLQQSCHNQIKMIYIDPPYNTGKDFVYKDDFHDNIANYKEVTEQKAVSNPETAGRYHTNWLNMIYPRLRVAKTLLREDGVIFISIDDNEVHNLRKVCDEVFGEDNFVANIVWQKKYAATNDSKGFSTTHDYIVVYQKSGDFSRNLLPRTKEQNTPYKHNDNDGKGVWRSDNLLVKSFSESAVYPITNPNTGVEYMPPEGSSWRASKETMKKWFDENRIYFGKDGEGAPQLKRYLNEVQQGRVPITWWNFEEVGHNDAANKELAALFNSKTPFDTPKPSTLLYRILQIGTNPSDIILDFFSGSSTTAHAVMHINAEDGGSRKFIMVQLPEKTDEKSEAFKAGYKNICEIGKERIRRAGEKIKSELLEKSKKHNSAAEDNSNENCYECDPGGLDIGFKVFKLDTSSIRKWDSSYVSADDVDTLINRLNDMVDTIKHDRSDLDVVYEVMLKLGLDLNWKVTKLDIDGKPAYAVREDCLLIICLAENVSAEMVEKMADYQPGNIVFAESCFSTDTAIANAELVLKDKGVNIKVI